MTGVDRILLLVALVALVLSPTADVSATDSCDRLIPSVSPEWAVDGAFQDPHTLLLADPWDRELFRYDLQTRRSGRVEGHLSSALSQLGPVGIKARAKGFAVRLETNKILLLDPWMRPEKVRNFEEEMGVHRLVPMTLDLVANSLITCGDIKREEDDPWVSGFIEVPLRKPDEYRMLYAFEEGESTKFERTRLFCQLMGPYVASVNGNIYLLIVKEKPRIFRVAPAGEAADSLVPLRAFPSAVATRPELPGLLYGGNHWSLMNAIQTSDLPVAMFGEAGYLYVVTRTSLGGGASEWGITKIDPRKDVVVGNAILPTTQAHVIPIPGPTNWAFLEKGPSGDWNDPHEVESILVVPSKQIRDIGGDEVSRLCQ